MSNLLNKSSILLTPTAYDNGKILSVKPAPGLGSELITNGDFTNGSTGWTLSSAWSIGTNKAVFSDTISGDIRTSSTVFTANKKYQIKLTVADLTSGTAFFALGDGAASNLANYANYANGEHTFNVTAPIGQELRIYSTTSSGSSYSITNISIKEEIDGDFDFTRNSSATRVNSQGLIEDMQILSGDLVSNGDFSQEGSELVANGDFSNSFTNWISQGDSITIVDGAARINRITNTTFIQQNILTSGKTYLVEFDVLNKPDNNGTFIVRLGSNSVYDVVSYEGTRFSKYMTSTGVDFRIYSSSNSGVVYVDNVSVKEVGQDWSVTGSDANNYVEFNGSTARLKFLNTSPITQLISSFVMTAGKKYKLTVDVASITSGSIKISGSGISELFDTVGTTTRIIIPTLDTAIKFYRATANVDVTLNSVSLIEITDDTNLPRIDYTGGEGHWLFEPQMTNLYLYSEPTANEGSTGNILYESFNWAIGFSNCVKYGDNSTTRYRYGGTISASTEYTLSAFVIMDDLSEPIIGGQTSGNDFTFVIGGAVYSNANSSINMGNNIWRVSVTATSTASPSFTNNGIVKYTAQSNKGFRVVGYQLEQNSYATSYIPTNGSTVTRLKDAAFGAGSSDLINSTEGVLYAEIAALANDNIKKDISLSDGTTSNRIILRYGDQSNKIEYIVISGGAIKANMNISSFNILNYLKIAIKWKLNYFALWVNGVEVRTDTSGSTFAVDALNQLNFDNGIALEPFFGKAKCVAVFKESLTDAELTCLTTI